MNLTGRTTGPISRRPSMGVVIVAGVRVLDGLLLLLAAADVRDVAGQSVWQDLAPTEGILDAAFITAAVLSFLVAIGLLIGHRWGWTGAVLLTGIGLFLAIWAYVGGAGSDVRLIILVVSVFYLNQPAVRERYIGPRS